MQNANTQDNHIDNAPKWMAFFAAFLLSLTGVPMSKASERLPINYFTDFSKHQGKHVARWEILVRAAHGLVKKRRL